MGLFANMPAEGKQNERSRPLADRMRPRNLDEFVGQEQIGLSTAPVWLGNRLSPRPVVFRAFVAASGDAHVVMPGGEIKPAGEVFGWSVITRQYFDRYRLPVMHTETNRTAKYAVEWLWKEWMNLLRLREDGVPIIGFTWFGLVDMKDWDTALTRIRGPWALTRTTTPAISMMTNTATKAPPCRHKVFKGSPLIF